MAYESRLFQEITESNRYKEITTKVEKFFEFVFNASRSRSSRSCDDALKEKRKSGKEK